MDRGLLSFSEFPYDVWKSWVASRVMQNKGRVLQNKKAI